MKIFERNRQEEANKQVVLISASRPGNSEHVNNFRHILLGNRLFARGINYQEAKGGRGQDKGFVCIVTNEEVEALKQMAINEFEQECILLRDVHGVWLLHEVDIEQIGHYIKAVPSFVAELCESYIKVNGTYFVVA